MTTSLGRRIGAAAIVAVLSAPFEAAAQEPPATAQAPAAAPGVRHDSLANGTLTGAGVGFGAGFLGLAAFNAKETDSGPVWDREAVGYYTAAGLLGAGIGAGLGALVDALKRPASPARARLSRVDIVPTMTRHRRGAVVALRY